MRNLRIALSLCFSLSILWGSSISAQIDSVHLHFPETSACAGDTIFYPLTMSVLDSTAIAGFQFGVSWGDNQLTYLGTCELAVSTIDNVVTVQTETEIQFTWVDFGSLVLDVMDGDTLLILKFLADDIPPGGVDIIFDPTVSAFEIVTANFQAYVPNTTNGRITRDETINLVAQAEAIDCRDSLAQLTASALQPATTYSWTGPDNFLDSIANPFTDTTGLYTVIGQNGNCFDTAQVMVVYDTVTPTNLELFTDTLTCSNSAVDLLGSVSEVDVNYQWFTLAGMSLSADTNLVTVTTGGSYVLEATLNENACSVNDTITVMVDTLGPDLAVAAGPYLLDCFTESIELLSTSQTSPISWEWTAVGNAAVLSMEDSLIVTSADNYQVLVTNLENGCQDSLSVEVTQDTLSPAFELIGDTLLTCDQPTQQLLAQSALSLEYEWYNSTATLLSQEDSLTVNTPGEYELFGTNPMNGCSDSLTIAVVIDTIAPVGFLSATVDTLDCVNESVLFSVVMPTSDRVYQWQNSLADSLGNGGEITLTAAGDYQLLTTNPANGCSGITPFSVVLDTLLPTFQILVPDTLTCGVLSVSLDIVPNDPAWLCNWPGLAANCSVAVGSAGWYQAEVTNPSNGCVAMDSIEVIVSPNNVSVDITSDFPDLTCLNPSLVLTANANSNVTWRWENAAGDVLGTEDTLTVSTPGMYFVFVEDEFTSCLASAMITISENTDIPMVNLLGDNELTCADTTQTWRAEAPMGEVLAFEWLNNTGTILSNADTLVVDTSGSYELLVAADNGCVDTLSFDVFQNTLAPDVDVMPVTASLDCLTDSVRFDFFTTTTNYEPVWSNAMGDPIGTLDSLILMTAGDYRLLLTDLNNGCQTETVFTLLIDTLAPVFSLPLPDTLDCVQQSVTLSIEGTSPGDLCSWLQIADDCDVIVSEAGTYMAEVTNPQNGCQSRDSVTVISNAEVLVMTVEVSQEINCLNDSAELTIVDALPTVEYSWSGPPGTDFASGAMITVMEAGNYEVIGTATDSGCRDSVTVAVVESLSPPVGSAASSGDLDCQQTVVELSVIMSDTTTSFTWSDASGAEIDPTTITTAGTYYLELVNNSSFCTELDSVSIIANDTPPEINWNYMGDSLITCNQPQVELIASSNTTPATITWIEPTSGSLLQTGASFISGLPQTIQLTVTDDQTSCSQDTLITIFADLTPPNVAILELSTFDCQTMEASLGSASPGADTYAYEWRFLGTGGAAPATPNQDQTLVFQAGSYELSIENLQNGCVASDTFELADNSLNVGEVSVLVLNPGCANSTGSIEVLSVGGGTAPYLYSLNNGALSALSSFAGLEAGSYLLSIEDAVGCTFDTSLLIVPTPNLELSVMATEGPYQLGDVVDLSVSANRLLTSQDSAVWYREDTLICNDCLSITDTLLTTTTYTVTVIGEDGCTATITITLSVNENIEVFVPNAFSPNNDGSNEGFQVYSSKAVAEIEEWRVFDRWGGLVFGKENIAPNDNSIFWDGTREGIPMQIGVYVYFLRIRLINGKEITQNGEVLLLR